MMTNIQATTLRTGATAVITALAVAFTLYPHDIWIPAIITAASAVGIHAIPSIQQNALTVISAAKNAAATRKVTTMTDTTSPANTTPVSSQTADTEAVAPELTDPVGHNGAALMGLTPAPIAQAEKTLAVSSTVAPGSAPVSITTTGEPISEHVVTSEPSAKSLIGDAISALKRAADAME